MLARLIPAVLGLALLLGAADAHALNPSRTYKQLPDKYNMKYEPAKVKTNDGAAELNVWNFPAKTKTTATVLIAHSGEGNMADYLRRVDQFTSTHNVVIFDWRGFGESSEFEIDSNMYIYPHFQDDMTTMFDYTRKKYAATFDVYGFGALGGGLALGVGWSRPEARRIIADTPFLSMEDLENRFSDWDEPMEVPFAGFEKRYEPVNSIPEIAPGKNLQTVQIIVGSNDRLFKSTDYDGLVKARKKLIAPVWVVENPDRKDNVRVDKAAYFAKVKEVLGAK